jgi:hypothetical protein
VDTTTPPDNEYDLAARIDALGPDDSYDDLRTLMVAAHGQDAADRLFERAHLELEHDYAIESAQSELAAALHDAETALTAAVRALLRLTEGDAWHVEYAEGTTGDDIKAFLDTAARSVRATNALDSEHRPDGLDSALKNRTTT